MLTFLRKIRRSLLDSGRRRKPASPAGRYVLYAIGEIALVVIGILIALQINNWNADRKQAQNEAFTLNEILNDLKEDQDQIKFIIEKRDKANEATLELLDNLNDPSYSVDSISKYVATFLTFERYFPLSNTFEMMKSTGLKLPNRKLGSEISRYYDYEQKKIAQSILDIEIVFVRIMNTKNSIRQNLEFMESGANSVTSLVLKNAKGDEFLSELYNELIGFRDNNGATLDNAIEFRNLNKSLIKNIELELETPRVKKYLD